MIPTYRPRSGKELMEAMKDSAVGGRTVAIEGGGTKLGWLGHWAPAEARIETSGLRGLIEHPEVDRRITARAGTPFSELERLLAERRLRIPFDPPRGDGDGATLGGLFASDDAGPGRLAHGSLRQLALAVTVAGPDGRLDRLTDGLLRLHAGAFGTLGVILELTLPLVPEPERELTVRAPMSLLAAARRSEKLSRLSPTAITHQEEALWVRFEGPAPMVEARSKAAEAELGDGAERLEASASRLEWRLATERRRGGAGETTVAAFCRPTALAALAARAEHIAARDGVPLRVIADPGLGFLLLHFGAGFRAFNELRLHAREHGGDVTMRDRPTGLESDSDPPSEATQAILRALDPVGRCNPGLFTGTPRSR